MIEDSKEIEHYAIVDLNPVKREVICWIASEEGKVRGYLFDVDNLQIDILFIPINLGVFSCMVRS